MAAHGSHKQHEMATDRVGVTPPVSFPLPPAWNDEERAPLRVVLADDHAIVREGVKSLVNAQQDMQVVGEASNGEDAVRIVGELVPDAIVMDLSMPGMGGAAATAHLVAEFPKVKVVALTVREEPGYLAQLLKVGARGYVLKRSAPASLVHAIRAAVTGGTYIDPAIATTVVRGYLQSRRHVTDSSPATLSERERVVLAHIAKGYSNQEIAKLLEISVKSVETYKARFVEKLGIRTRVEIARYAAEHDLDDRLAGGNPQ
jgi:DNA-binding NarL/FixJ family response regulator